VSSSGVLSPPQVSGPIQTPNYALLGGGYFSLAFAVFQVTGIWWPSSAIRYLGGPAELSVQRPFLYAFLCLTIGAIVAVFGLYALSGARKIRPLPLLRTGLITITLIYLLRGLLFIPQLPVVMKNPHLVRFLIFSLISLFVGILYLLGVIRLYRQRHNPSLKKRS